MQQASTKEEWRRIIGVGRKAHLTKRWEGNPWFYASRCGMTAFATQVQFAYREHHCKRCEKVYESTAARGKKCQTSFVDNDGLLNQCVREVGHKGGHDYRS